ncbi:hypothetical protein N656DRAFT_770092 [Canariomyces notabilis]|uniref:Uncharacterized protein n=1 Tax=Canariomyces notabilis TaxID=2074819 RepID=A0AAN6QHM3_9PEZI|nr:hypothetical protein N656DRAFT_770092 [Canariomyces arenarius]
MAALAAILKRQQFENCSRTPDGFLDESTCYVPFWATRTGTIIKWSLFFGLILLCVLYLLVGYVHAQRRLNKGLAPLGYHRFLVSRASLARVDPHYQYSQPENTAIYPYAPGNNYYDMHAMPPPVYDPNAPRPPKYEPPAGATKVDFSLQHEQGQQPAGEGANYVPPPGPPPSSVQPPETYAQPPGPPPSSVQPQSTGSNNPFRG